jgi:hypothetical protein
MVTVLAISTVKAPKFAYLSDIVDRIILHWLNKCQSVLVAGASACNAECHGSSITDMGIVRLGQQLYYALTHTNFFPVTEKR